MALSETKSGISKTKGILLINLALLVAVGLLSSGCMNVRGAETINSASVEKEQFRNRKIAVLPVKEQAALSTDSLLSLRTALNEKLGEKVREKLGGAKIIDENSAVTTLNRKGKLGTLDELLKTYDSTGVFDSRLVSSLCNCLGVDYIVVSRLKAEKMSVGFVGKGFGASLEVMLVSHANSSLIWAGSGEFKRGGMLGFGTTNNKAAADQLVNLAFSKF